jgi:hypothetical protein
MLFEKIKNKLGMPRIMFLDIDGVLCTMRSEFAFGDDKGLMMSWDITCCQMVRVLCEKFGFKIVISSTWRNQNTTEKLRSHLCIYGLISHLYNGKGERKNWFYGSKEKSFEWRTKFLKRTEEKENGHNIRRGKEIEEWLNRHPFISDYVIIDDDRDMLEKQMSHFVHIEDGEEGFSSKNFSKICGRYIKSYT